MVRLGSTKDWGFNLGLTGLDLIVKLGETLASKGSPVLNLAFLALRASRVPLGVHQTRGSSRRAAGERRVRLTKVETQWLFTFFRLRYGGWKKSCTTKRMVETL